MRAIRDRLPIALIALGGLGLRFWRLDASPLIADEAYYWVWSQHLAPGYYDHPAGVALLVRLSVALCGSGEAGIRWLNAALGTVCVLLTYALALRTAGPGVALAPAAVVSAGAPLMITSRYVYTDTLQQVLVLANLLLLTRVADPTPTPPPRRWFLAVGLTMGALLNTKYGAYLYAVVMVCVVIAVRPGIVRTRAAWGAFLLALAGALPTALWNAQHDWVSFRWQIAHFSQGVFDKR